MRACEFLTILVCVMGIGLCGHMAFGQDRPATQPAPTVGGKVHQIKVVADKAPDCSSLKAMVATVTRGCKSNDEKAIAIYNFLRMVNYHRQYPSEKGGIPALKLINVYGWSLCGGQHAALSALWRAAGWEWRFVGWQGHTTVEAFYDDQWHYFDTFLKIYLWKPFPNAAGRTVASQADIAEHPEMITDGLVLDKARKVYYHKGNQFELIGEKANWMAPAFLVCGDEPQGVISGVKGRNRVGPSPGWAGIRHDDSDYSTDVDLAPGYSLELMWKPIEGAHWWNGRKDVPGHTCGDKDYRNCPAIGPVLEPYAYLDPRGARTFASGKLIFEPDCTNDRFLAGLAGQDNVKLAEGKLVPADPSRPGSITVELQSPYVMSRGSGSAEGADSAEISLDGGKTFKPIDLKDFSEQIGGNYACLVRLTFKKALAAPRLEVIVQHNRCALPYLSPGKNRITVSLADPKQLGLNRLVVTYAYQPGWRNRSYEELAERDAEVARAHSAEWSKAPTVVQKVFAASDLPATFEIDVPTLKDKHPIYPRMLYLRRQVMASCSEPPSLPEDALEPKLGPNDQLKELPNPFLMGIAKPPEKPQRPTVTRKIALEPSHVVDMKGNVYGLEQFIKWLKDNSEAWVLLLGADLKDLPEAKSIATARIVVPVVNGHEQAPTKIAAVMLKVPFEKGKAYDFKNLGETIGTAIVPKTAAGQKFDPPKDFPIDVTRAVKQIARGEAKCPGLALRTVPDRSVDDGWTVRVNVAPTVKPTLEIDVYADK